MEVGGALAGAWLGGALGRKATVLLSAGRSVLRQEGTCWVQSTSSVPGNSPSVPTVLGWMLIAIAQDSNMLFAGR